MIYVLAVLHVIFCVSIIALILLHSGKGGGLSSSMGGGMGSTFSGTTIMEKNLTRLTVIILGLFVVTNIVLVFIG